MGRSIHDIKIGRSMHGIKIGRSMYAWYKDRTENIQMKRSTLNMERYLGRSIHVFNIHSYRKYSVLNID